MYDKDGFSVAAWAQNMLSKGGVQVQLTKSEEEKLRTEGFSTEEWVGRILMMGRHPEEYAH